MPGHHCWVTPDTASLLDDLAVAVREGDIRAHYQPQIDMVSGDFIAAEALARWDRPGYGPVAPDVFIPLAEEHGLIDDLGLSVLDQAWARARFWIAAGTPLQVAVNVSVLQFVSPRLTDRLRALLLSGELPRHTMVIEVTESAPFVDGDDAFDRLHALRDLGLGISVDDFGVGHSTYERLELLPATELKIDMSLVHDETDDGYAVFAEIVEYARDRDLCVVAEGVETERQRDRVGVLRCHRGQGYLFARPMEGDSIEGAVRAQSTR